MNSNKIVVYDFETCSTDPTQTDPVQLAAVIIDPKQLKIVENSEFVSWMKPDAFKVTDDTLEFHCKVRNQTKKEILDIWYNAPSQKEVWEQFNDYLGKYHTTNRKSKFTAPIACGYNIIKFDNIISNRLQQEHLKSKYLFHPRDIIDLMHWLFPFFENNPEITSLSLDSIRDYFGMNKDNAHDALIDVKFCAEILIKLMRVYRYFSPKISFKNSFAKVPA